MGHCHSAMYDFAAHALLDITTLYLKILYETLKYYNSVDGKCNPFRYVCVCVYVHLWLQFSFQLLEPIHKKFLSDPEAQKIRDCGYPDEGTGATIHPSQLLKSHPIFISVMISVTYICPLLSIYVDYTCTCTCIGIFSSGGASMYDIMCEAKFYDVMMM